MAGRLDSRVAVVTGAGAGIGRAIALRLGADGAAVVATDIDHDAAAATAATIRDDDGVASSFGHDVVDEDAWVRVIADTVSGYGGLDVLVNNAGVYTIAPLSEATLDEWNPMMSVNVTGVFLGMKHASTPMRSRRGGSIVNIASIAGLIGVRGHVLYGGSKGAVGSMTKSAAVELAPQRIRVNSVHPSYIRTGMAEYGAEVAGSTVDEIGARCPLGRLGEPDDVAAAVTFLASEDAAFITGIQLVVDGGVSAGAARVG